MNKSIFLFLLCLVFSNIHAEDKPFQYNFNGYIWNTTNFEYLKKDNHEFFLNQLKLNAQLKGKPSEDTDFNLSLTGEIYTGRKEFDVFKYIPWISDKNASFYYVNLVYFDEAYGSWYNEKARFRFGRQKLIIGNSWGYNLIDLFNYKSLVNPTIGIDAVSFSYKLLEKTEIQALARFQSRISTVDFMFRVKTAIDDNLEMAFNYTNIIKERIDWESANLDTRQIKWNLLGGEILYNTGNYNFHSEFAVAVLNAVGNIGTLGSGTKDHARLLLGMDKKFFEKLLFVFEYAFIGSGRTSFFDYSLNDYGGYMNTELPSINRDNVFIAFKYFISEKSEATLYSWLGLNDPSAVFNPWFKYKLSSVAEISLHLYFPVGASRSQNGLISNYGFVRFKINF